MSCIDRFSFMFRVIFMLFIVLDCFYLLQTQVTTLWNQLKLGQKEQPTDKLLSEVYKQFENDENGKNWHLLMQVSMC